MTDYIVRGKKEPLAAVAKVLRRSKIPINVADGKLRVSLRDTSELIKLQNVCKENNLKYTQE